MVVPGSTFTGPKEKQAREDSGACLVFALVLYRKTAIFPVSWLIQLPPILSRTLYR